VSSQPNGVPQTKPLQEIVDNVDASRIDGRARQVLYRQKQLRGLHNYLIKNKAAVVRALQDGMCQRERFTNETDTKRTRLECEFEFAYSVEVLEQHFNRLNFKKSIQTEKQIPEAPPVDWREPLGTVAIVSGTSSIPNLVINLIDSSSQSLCVPLGVGHRRWELRRYSPAEIRSRNLQNP
jgi:hypothetical protein